MLRYCYVLVSLTGLTFAGYPDGHSGNDIGNGNGQSYGYGYSGSFSGGGQPNFQGSFPGPPFDFPGFLNNYLGSLNNYHQEFIRNIQAAAQGYGNAGGFGGSYSGGNGAAYGGGTGGAYGGSYSGPGSSDFAPAGAGFAPNGGGAYSAAHIGPDGGHQTAAVFPENPSFPNINTRFGASDQPGGFRSVFTSSQSETTNIGGKPHTVERAQTTINDNGKITTYTAKNP